jgi:hypothetical protein
VPIAPGRAVIIDENLPRRLASEITKRGRAAYSVGDLRLDGLKDPELLRQLAARFPDGWVLVTADDALPEAHPDVIAEVAATIAIVHPRLPEGWSSTDAWRREAVHRWVHAMAAQDAGTVRRYSERSGTQWRARARAR